MLASVKIMTASASLKFPLYSGVEPLIFKALPLSSFCNLPHDKLDPRRMARRSFVRPELQSQFDAVACHGRNHYA